jgi:O-antigen/teichoic acid export membrane protein
MAETFPNANLHLTGGRLLAGNVVWNLFGSGAPLIVAVFSIPILIHRLGDARFGILTLAWALVGYSGFFDMGLGRALTQLVAKKLGAGQEEEIPILVWTSLLLMLVLGIVGTVVVGLISPWLVHHALRIPEGIQPETLTGFYVLGLAVPAVIITAGLRGLLEAHQRFDLVNALRIPMGVLTFLGPLMALPFSSSLVPVVGVLVAVRFIGCFAHLWCCFRVVPELRRRVTWHAPVVGPLLKFGGWTTVTSVIGPMMLYMDRFVIGALVSATAVAYYATPYEVVTKILVASGAISAVMFPAFTLAGATDRRRSAMLYNRTMIGTIAVLVPTTILLILGARRGLSIWLGQDFASHSYHVAQLLLVGTFALAMESLPFVLIQGLGRPDLPAKLNLVEIPFYVAGLYFLVEKYGVTGAAVAWVLRAIVDALFLIYFAHRLQTQRTESADIPRVGSAFTVSTER